MRLVALPRRRSILKTGASQKFAPRPEVFRFRLGCWVIISKFKNILSFSWFHGINETCSIVVCFDATCLQLLIYLAGNQSANSCELGMFLSIIVSVAQIAAHLKNWWRWREFSKVTALRRATQVGIEIQQIAHICIYIA